MKITWDSFCQLVVTVSVVIILMCMLANEIRYQEKVLQIQGSSSELKQGEGEKK